jgi:hypothetical protein
MALGSVTFQVLTAASGTYTPTASMAQVLALLVGGGAGGAAATATDEAGGGGGAGGTAIELLSAADIGASKAFAVGAAVATTTNGNPTSIGSGPALVQATGGLTGAVTGGTTTLGVSAAGGAGGVGSLGTLNIQGQQGNRGTIFSTADGLGGPGGESAFGGSGLPDGSNAVGGNAGAYGSGGAGGHASGSPNRDGGTGSAGVIYLLEFISAPSGNPWNSYAQQ